MVQRPDRPLLEHRPQLGKGQKALDAMVMPHAAVAGAAKGQIVNARLNHRLVDAKGARDAGRSSQNWVIDHGKIMQLGCSGIRAAAQARLDTLQKSPLDLVNKVPFLEAVIITCDAMSTWAQRYADKATEMAATEANAQRKAELLEIAAACARVPELPCQSFCEALQVQWFSQCMSRFEEMIGGDINQRRMDQYLWPYYQADIKQGTLTEEEATELFHCLWINMVQYVQITLSPACPSFDQKQEVIS